MCVLWGDLTSGGRETAMASAAERLYQCPEIWLVRILNIFGSWGVEESSIFISKGAVDKCQQFIILLAHVWKLGPLGGNVVESKFVLSFWTQFCDLEYVYGWDERISHPRT